MFGSYFFLNDDLILHNRNTYTFSDMLSDFGGIYQTFIIGLFYYLGSIINKRIMMGKLIRSLYHVEKSIMLIRSSVIGKPKTEI